MSSGSRASKKAKSSTSRITKRRRPNKGSLSSNASARSGSATLTLNEDWSEFLHALISSGTRFLLIGGHAVAIHAEPRFTEDLDVFVEPTLRNARKLHAALVDFGFAAVAPLPAQLAEPDKVWMLGRKPRRIDILTGISGVSFKAASQHSILVEVHGHAIPVIGRAALLKNKIASNRDKDQLDVLLLKKYASPNRRR